MTDTKESPAARRGREAGEYMEFFFDQGGKLTTKQIETIRTSLREQLSPESYEAYDKTVAQILLRRELQLKAIQTKRHASLRKPLSALMDATTEVADTSPLSSARSTSSTSSTFSTSSSASTSSLPLED